MDWLNKMLHKSTNKEPTQILKQISDDGPSMHILCLNTTNKELYGIVQEGQMSIPAVTTDGRISFLPVLNNKSFDELKQTVSNKINEHPDYPSAANFAVVGVNITRNLDEEKVVSFFITEILSSVKPMLELEDIYNKILGLTVVGYPYWISVESYLSSEPRRSWINDIIQIWKQYLNWPQFIDNAIKNVVENNNRT
jgi:hypothetical protein